MGADITTAWLQVAHRQQRQQLHRSPSAAPWWPHVAVRPVQHLPAELRSCCTNSIACQPLFSKQQRVYWLAVWPTVWRCAAVLLQDIVTASPHFSVEGFVPRLRDYLRVTNPYKRQFLISWVRQHGWQQDARSTTGCASHYAPFIVADGPAETGSRDILQAATTVRNVVLCAFYISPLALLPC
jgi:hypothetical protein